MRQLVLCAIGAVAAISTNDPLIVAAVGVALMVSLFLDAAARRGNP